MDKQTYSFTPITKMVFPRWTQTASIGICPLKPNGKPLKAVKRLKAKLIHIVALNAAAQDYCERLNAMDGEEQQSFLQGESYTETVAPNKNAT